MNYSFVILLLAVGFTSCNEKKTRPYSPTYTGLPGGMNTVPGKGPSGPSNTVQFGPNNQDSSTNPLLKGQPANTTTTQPVQTASSGNLNPAHGQPGHRCDLAVGEPLGQAKTLPATTSTPVTTTPVITTAPAQKTAPGKNPAHGQPGHRCDIAVGEPLNSPVAKTDAKPAITNSITPATTPTQDTSVGKLPEINIADKSVKLNPAHGQPGHDCSIAVGKPLKQ